jgi:hypothetical protein
LPYFTVYTTGPVALTKYRPPFALPAGGRSVYVQFSANCVARLTDTAGVYANGTLGVRRKIGRTRTLTDHSRMVVVALAPSVAVRLSVKLPATVGATDTAPVVGFTCSPSRSGIAGIVCRGESHSICSTYRPADAPPNAGEAMSQICPACTTTEYSPG